jgi:hypothetical protein
MPRFRQWFRPSKQDHHRSNRPSDKSSVHFRNLAKSVSMKTASEEVLDLIFLSKSSGQTLCAGAELGVFDHMSQDKARAAGEVAAEIDLDPGATPPATAGAYITWSLERDHGGRFHLDGTRRPFVQRCRRFPSIPGAMLAGGLEHRAIWERVPLSIKDGQQNASLSVPRVRRFHRSISFPLEETGRSG